MNIDDRGQNVNIYVDDENEINMYVDDENEIIRIAKGLSRDRKYGAAQLIYRLARERDDARIALSVALKKERP